MTKLTKTFSTLGLASALLFSSMSGASASEVHYKDVKEDDNFYKSVEYLLDHNAISETLPEFNPYDNITRGQMVSILVKVLGLDVTNVENPNFTDVPPTHQFYPYISALENDGILGGKGDGTFGVNEPLTRGQMAGILVKTYEIPLVGVQNVRSSKSTDIIESNGNLINTGAGENTLIEDYKFKGQWGQQIGTMNYYGFISGTGDGNFKPNQPIKRSQFANMIYQIQRKDIHKRYAFVDYEKMEELGLAYKHNETYRIIEDKNIIDFKETITSDMSYYDAYDPFISSGSPYQNLEYVIYEPKKEGETFVGYNNNKVKVIVSKDSESNWKLDFEKVVKEDTTTTGDTATIVTQDTANIETTNAK